ncbi:MAG: hypothetical protein HYT79_04835 [Elusimicrobia bacterium]|nr:hypothetical protein [Elusimicrobiota bacterium]
MTEEPSAPSSETSAQAPVQPELSYREILKRLIALQVKDSELIGLRAQIEEINATILAAQEALKQEEADLQKSKEAQKQLTLDHKNCELEIGKFDAEIAKRAGSLQQVKTNEAYQALLAEMGALKKKKDDAETKILEILETMDVDKKAETENRRAFETTKRQRESEIKEIEIRRSGLEQEAKNRQGERDALVGDLPPSVYTRYERLRARREGVALVPILEGSSCGGCQMHATQQVINDLLKGKDFLSCERCQRILYIPEKT